MPLKASVKHPQVAGELSEEELIRTAGNRWTLKRLAFLPVLEGVPSIVFRKAQKRGRQRLTGSPVH
jgi:hypothetical protein